MAARELAVKVRHQRVYVVILLHRQLERHGERKVLLLDREQVDGLRANAIGPRGIGGRRGARERRRRTIRVLHSLRADLDSRRLGHQGARIDRVHKRLPQQTQLQ